MRHVKAALVWAALISFWLVTLPLSLALTIGLRTQRRHLRFDR